MCGVDFTVYDLVPAGAAWLRAVWVKHSNPPTVDESGGGAVAPQPTGSEPALAGRTDPIGDQAVHAEVDRVTVPAGLDDPRVDREPLLVGR